MRLDRIQIHGLGPYTEDVDVDLREVAGLLVAVTGPNGAGKSTMLELVLGALKRVCATRGTLAHLATERDAWVQVLVDGVSIRQMVDAVNGKGETLITRDGVSLLESGKVSEGDAWIDANMPPRAVLESSQVAVQGKRGFLDLKRADRMRVLLRTLRVELLEALAAQGTTRAQETAADADALRSRLSEERARTPDQVQVEVDLKASRAEAAELASEVEQADKALQRARSAAEDEARAQELRDQRKAVQARLERIRGQLDDVDARTGNNTALLERADEIRSAITKAAALQTAARAAQQAGGEHVRTRNEASSKAREHEASAETATATAAAARRRGDAARERLADRPKIEEAARHVATFTELLAEAREQVDAMRRESDELRDSQLHHKDRRIGVLRFGLTQISEGNVPDAEPDLVAGYAREVISDDDKLVTEFEQLPETLRVAAKAYSAAVQKVTETQASLDQARQLAARAGELDQAEEAKATADQEQRAAEQQAQESTEAASSQRTIEKLASAKVQNCDEDHAKLVKRLLALEPDVGKAPKLEVAEGRLEVLGEQRTNLLAEKQEATAELASLPDLEDKTVESQVADCARDLGTHKSAAEAVARKLGMLEGRLEDAKTGAAKIAEFEREIAVTDGHHSDWLVLAGDLGRDGLQACEVDAAIPEVNEIANELLHTCHGPRFTVELRTDRVGSKGQLIEDLDVWVYDSKKGREDLAESYSGGELVIVGEAIALALTQIGCRDLERPTLIRDESGASLDSHNGPAYIAMLRRAAETIGADKVLYVTHDEGLKELADARVAIDADGRVEVLQ